MRAVFGSGVLAVEAALGGVGLVDVDDLEVVAKEELADARGWAWSRVFEIVSGPVSKGDDGALPCLLGHAVHAMLEGGDEL